MGAFGPHIFYYNDLGERGLEPLTSCSQSRRAANCATPRNMNQHRGFTLKLRGFIEGPRRGAGTSHFLCRVLVVGLEPTRVSTLVLEANASANYATPACFAHTYMLHVWAK